MDRRQKAKVGILGGTFNPVHNGHLTMAAAARKQFGLQKIIFIPTYLPPHKSSREIVSGSDRKQMLRRALAGHPEYEVSDIELKRGGRSYTITTVRELKKGLPRGARIYLIIGADNLLEIASWREIESLVRCCCFIVVTRPGYPLEKLEGENARWAKEILAPDRSNLIELSLPVSSTLIRERARKGVSLKGLVPEKVWDYIKKKGLYGLRNDVSKRD